jgi:SAM-dependent methyltransferase
VEKRPRDETRGAGGRRAASLLGPRQLWHRLRTEAAKRFGLGHKLEELSAALAGRELFFRSPPLDPELVRAIKAITPQFSLGLDETSRRIWELSQNGSSWAEYEALEPLLLDLGEPARILEIGPGLGRSVVFLVGKLGWRNARFDLYEGNGEARKYPLNAPRSADSFCGDLVQLRRVLDHNRIENYRLHDAAEVGGRLDGLPGPYDLVYSFYGVGFHWSLADFWPEIRGLLAPGGVGLFTVHHSFEEFPELAATPRRYVPFRRILAKDRPLNLLVVADDTARLEPLGGAA